VSRRDTSTRHSDLLHEINAERIAALTRISRTLEGLIAELHAIRARLDLGGVDRDETLAHYTALRHRAKQYRWYLDVQRESLGLRHHRLLDELYAIPGPMEEDDLPRRS
jgi:hypothetical protein